MRFTIRKSLSHTAQYNEGEVSPTPKPNRTEDSRFKVVEGKFRFMTPKFRVYALFLLLILSGIGGYILYRNYVTPHNVRVSNVTDRSASISWVTKSKSKGYVIVSENGFLLPVRVSGVGETVNYDDRDWAAAELQAYEKLKETSAKNSRNGETELGELPEVKVDKVGAYYVHHVTVRDLDPESTYQFMVGNGTIFTRKPDNDNNKISFTTLSESEDVLVPDPAYGNVSELSFEKKPVTDGVLYLKVTDDTLGKESTLISAPLGSNGSWYADLTQAKDSLNTATPFMRSVNSMSESVYHKIEVEAGPIGRHAYKVSIHEDAPADTLFVELPEKRETNALVKKVFAETWSVTCPDGTSFSESNSTVHSTFNAVAGGDGRSRWEREACVGHSGTTPSGSGGGGPTATNSGGSWSVQCNGHSYCETNLSVQAGFNAIGARQGKPGVELWTQQACASNAPDQPCAPVSSSSGGSGGGGQEPSTTGGSGGGGSSSGGSSGGSCSDNVSCCGPSWAANEKPVGAECDPGSFCPLTAANGSWPNAGGCDGFGGKACEKCDSNGKYYCVLDGAGSCGNTSGTTPDNDDDSATGSLDPDELEVDPLPPDGSNCTNGSTVGTKRCVEGRLYDSIGDGVECPFNNCYCTESDSIIRREVICDNPPRSASSGGATGDDVSTAALGGTCTGNPLFIPSKDLYCHNNKWINYRTNGELCLAASGNCYCTVTGTIISNSMCGAPAGSPPVAGSPCLAAQRGQRSGSLICDGDSWEPEVTVAPPPAGSPPPAPAVGTTPITECKSGDARKVCITSAGNLGICKTNTGLGGSATHTCSAQGNGSIPGYGFINEGDTCNAPNGCECNNGDFVNSFVPSGGTCFVKKCKAGKTGIACDAQGVTVCTYVSPVRGSNAPPYQCLDAENATVSDEKSKYVANKVGGALVFGVSAQEIDDSTQDKGYYIDPTKGLIFTESGRYCTNYENSKVCFSVLSEGENQLFIDQNGDGLYNEGEVELNQQIEELGLEKEQSLFSIPVKAGFNLVSFPAIFEQLGTSATEALSYINAVSDDGAYSLAKFESGRWIVVGNRDGESFTSEDFQIVPGRGYLLRAKKDFSLNMTGLEVVDLPGVDLAQGWNLIAIHGTQKSYTAESLIDDLNIHEGLVVNNISRWDTSKARYDGLQKENDSAGTPQIYGFDFPISKIQGYFVRVQEGSGVWSPSKE